MLALFSRSDGFNIFYFYYLKVIFFENAGYGLRVGTCVCCQSHSSHKCSDGPAQLFVPWAGPDMRKANPFLLWRTPVVILGIHDDSAFFAFLTLLVKTGITPASVNRTLVSVAGALPGGRR